MGSITDTDDDDDDDDINHDEIHGHNWTSNCVRQDWVSWPALSGTWRRAAA